MGPVVPNLECTKDCRSDVSMLVADSPGSPRDRRTKQPLVGELSLHPHAAAGNRARSRARASAGCTGATRDASPITSSLLSRTPAYGVSAVSAVSGFGVGVARSKPSRGDRLVASRLLRT